MAVHTAERYRTRLGPIGTVRRFLGGTQPSGPCHPTSIVEHVRRPCGRGRARGCTGASSTCSVHESVRKEVIVGSTNAPDVHDDAHARLVQHAPEVHQAVGPAGGGQRGGQVVVQRDLEADGRDNGACISCGGKGEAAAVGALSHVGPGAGQVVV